MTNKAIVYVHNQKAGILERNTEGFVFAYDKAYIASASPQPVSLTLPLSSTPYHSKELFPFFEGLVQEGWLKIISERMLHIDSRDSFSLLVKNGEDCIGCVTLEETE